MRPGNVRELRNYVERTIVFETASPASRRLASSPSISGSETQVSIELPFKTAKDEITTAFEKKYLDALLQWAGGNVSMAARKAGPHVLAPTLAETRDTSGRLDEGLTYRFFCRLLISCYG